MTQLLPLSEVAEINPPTSIHAALDDMCSFVPMEAVDETMAEISRFQFRPYRELIKGYTPFAENDILLAKITPCMENGKCAIARRLRNAVGFGSTEFHVVRANPRALPEWIYYFWRLPQTRKFAEQKMTGSAGQKRVPTGFLEELRLPVPAIAEQQRQIERLRIADLQRRYRRYALQVCDEFLPAAFREIFGDPLKSKWPRALLGEHIEGLEGGINFNPVDDSAPASDWRVLKISALTAGEFDPQESKPISPEERFDQKLVVRTGDLLMSRANTRELVGCLARVRTKPPKVLLPDKLWRIQLKSSTLVLPDYLLYLLRTRALRREIEMRASGTSGSMKNISKEETNLLPIPIPPLETQRQFERIVQLHVKQRSTEIEALRQADHFFETLLHNAFN